MHMTQVQGFLSHPPVTNGARPKTPPKNRKAQLEWIDPGRLRSGFFIYLFVCLQKDNMFPNINLNALFSTL